MGMKMLCRLCLIEFNETGISLFSSNGRTEIILTIIKKALHLVLTPNDAISALICQKCWQHLHDFAEFCQYIEKQQNTLHEKCCAIVKNEPDAELALDAEDQDATAINTTSLPPYTAFNNNDEALLDIKDIISMEGGGAGAESTLHEEESKEEEFNSANLADEDAADVESANQDEIPLKQLFKNKILRKALKGEKAQVDKTKTKVKNTNKRSITSEESKAKKKKTAKRVAATSAEAVSDEELRKCEEFLNSNMFLKCEICEAKFQTFHLLRTHYSTQHNCRGYMKCCGKVIKTRTRLVDHIKYHLNPKQYECEMCKTYFRSKYNLSSHMLKVHPKTEQLRYTCPLCGKGFALNSDYERHVAQHQTERNSICEICQKGFTNKYCLTSHIHKVHKNPIYICNHCGKEYKDKLCFEEHVGKHEGIVIHTSMQCSTCGEWLKNKDCLRKHMELHKPLEIECKLCGRLCHTKRAYVAHVRYSHSNKEPAFSCTFCDKTFKRKENYQEHLAIHTGEKNNTCPHCPKEFRSKANMYAHVKRDHTEEWLQSKRSKIQNMQKYAKSDTTAMITTTTTST